MSDTTTSSSYLIIFSEIILKVVIGIFTSIILYTKLITIPRFESGKSLKTGFVATCQCTSCKNKQYTYPHNKLGFYRKLKTITVALFLLYMLIAAYKYFIPSIQQRVNKEQETAEAKILAQKVPYIYDLTDPWEILGVEENSDIKVVKKSYRKIMTGLHPDRIPAEYSDYLKKKIGDRFLLIQKAYETLTDPDLRERFDREGAIAQESYTFDFGIPKIFNNSENAARILTLYIILAVVIGVVIYKIFQSKNSIFGMSAEKGKFLASKLYLQRQNGLRNEFETLCTVCLASLFNHNINKVVLGVLRVIDPNIGTLEDVNSSKIMKNLKLKLNNELIKKLNHNFIRIIKAQDINVEHIEKNFKVANLIYVILKCYIEGHLEQYVDFDKFSKSFKQLSYLLEQIESTLSAFIKLAVEFNQSESIKQIIGLRNKIIENKSFDYYSDKRVVLESKTECVNFVKNAVALVEMKFEIGNVKGEYKHDNEGSEDKEEKEGSKNSDNNEEEDDLTLLQFKKEDNNKLPVLGHNTRYPFPVVESYYVIVKENKKIIFQDTITVKKYKNEDSNYKQNFFLQIPIERFLFEVKNNRAKPVKKSKLDKSVKLNYFVYPMFGDVKHLYAQEEIELPIKYFENEDQENTTANENSEVVENENDSNDGEKEKEDEDEISNLIDKYEKENIFNMDPENEGSWYTLGSRNALEFGCNLLLLYVMGMIVLSTNMGRLYLQPIVSKGKGLLRNGWEIFKRKFLRR